MIYTLTTNPAVDVTAKFKDIKENLVNRAIGENYNPNGKGVNVSFAMKALGKKTGALGFFGGFSGKFITDSLTNANIVCKPIYVEGNTRINYYATTEDGKEFKLNGNGCKVTKEKQNELLNLIQGLDDLTLLVISGSLANGMDNSFYDELAKILIQKNVPFAFDISTPYLKDLLKYKPLLIKPNDEELKDIFGLNCTTETETKNAMQTLHKLGAQNVLLTLGSKGMYFSNGKDLYFCKAYPIEFVSSVCAGDGALAGFLSAWFCEKETVENAIKLSSAVGADIAGSFGMGNFSRVEKIKNELVVKKII